MSKASRRFYRSLVLGVAALGVMIWAAIDQFGISREHMLNLFTTTLLIAGGVIVLAAAIAMLWVGVRKLVQRDNSD